MRIVACGGRGRGILYFTPRLQEQRDCFLSDSSQQMPQIGQDPARYLSPCRP